MAKFSPEFCKPKTFRDRKKHPTKKEEEKNHPLHEPYKRDKINNYLLDDWEDERREDNEE